MSKEKETFINGFDKYYNHLLNRMDNAMAYLKDNDVSLDSREYKAYEGIIKELGELEDIKLRYSLFQEEK